MRHGQEYSSEIADVVCASYHEGRSVLSLSKQHRLYRHTIMAILRSRGIEPRPWYHRLPHAPEIVEDYLQGIGLKELSRRYNTSQQHVTTVLRETGVEIRTSAEQRRLDIAAGRTTPWSGSIKRTVLQDVPVEGPLQELVNGLLLGDGSIRQFNGPPTLGVTNKSRQYVDYISSALTSLGVRNRVSIHNRRGHWRVLTRGWLSLNRLIPEWYEDGRIKRRIPDDLRITATVLLHWYLGDGSLARHIGKRPTIHLYTNSFHEDEVQRLCDLLGEQGVSAGKYHCGAGSQRHQYRIHINRAGVKRLMEMIGECPVQDYAYKWLWQEVYTPDPLTQTATK